MALDGMGLKDFRLFLLAQDHLDQAPEKGVGLEINMPLSLGIVRTILCGDTLTDMEYLTRPYEVVPAQTDKVMQEIADYLFEVFQKRLIRGKKWGLLAWHFLASYFADALHVLKNKFDAIEVQRIRARICIHRASVFERTCRARILRPDAVKILEYIRKLDLQILENQLKKLRAIRAMSGSAKFTMPVCIVRRYRRFAFILIWAEAKFGSCQFLWLVTSDAGFTMTVGTAI